MHLFDENSPAQKYFLDLIKARPTRPNLHQIRNRRYLELQKLQAEGQYFSNEKMREREPFLFDMMVGQYLDDRGFYLNLFLFDIFSFYFYNFSFFFKYFLNFIF